MRIGARKKEDARTCAEVLKLKTCPVCDNPAKSVYRLQENVVVFDHGHTVTVEWSDGLGMTTTGPTCEVIPRDAVVCDTPGCLDTRQNAAVKHCCSCLIRNSTPPGTRLANLLCGLGDRDGRGSYGGVHFVNTKRGTYPWTTRYLLSTGEEVNAQELAELVTLGAT